MSEIDEVARRAFESARRAGNRDDLTRWLPAADDPRFLPTLTEFLCIEREFAWKRCAGGGGEPPPLESVLAALPTLDVGDLETLHAEERSLARRYSSTPAAQLEAEGRIGRYELRERLGAGGYAQVWRARDPQLNRDVAIKIGLVELARDADALERFHREARAVARLQHPGIVGIHEVAEDHGRPFLVSELLPGPDLAEAMRTDSLGVVDAVRLVIKLARAVDYAHQCGIVHRDIKPANVVFDAQREPRLVDFGLATSRDAAVSMTQRGDVIGTPAYMSPEQARGEIGDVDARSDTYSLGVVLYELLCGRRPFEGESATRVMYAVAHESPPPPRRVRPETPRDLDTIVMSAMASERSRRYETSGRFADDLELFLEHRPIRARRSGVLDRCALFCRRNPALTAASIAGVLLATVIGSWGLWGILQERARFRTQRDLATDNLYRSLVGEAEARIAAAGTSWRRKALENLRTAAASASHLRDAAELRSLAARCMGVALPSVSVGESWSDDRIGTSDLVWSPDGTLVVQAGRDGMLRVRNARDGRVVAHLVGGTDQVYDLAFDPGGHHLVSGARDGTLRIWDLASIDSDGSGLPRIEAEHTRGYDGHAVTSVCFAPDGTALAIGLGRTNSPGPVIVFDWNRESATPLGSSRTFGGHAKAVLCATFSTDGSQLVTAGEECSLSVWDLATGESIAVIPTSDPARDVIAIGNTVFFTTRESYGCGRIDGDLHLDWFPGLHDGSITRLGSTPDGRLLTSGDDGSIRCWDTALHPLAVANCDRGPITALALDDQGERGVVAFADGILTFAIDRSDLIEEWRTTHSAVFIPDSARLLAGTAVHEFHDDGSRATVQLRAPAVTCLDVDRSGLLFIGSADGQVRAQSATGGFASWPVSDQAITRVRRARHAPLLAVLDATGTIRIVAAQSGATIETFTEPPGCADLAWQDDGTLVSAGSAGVTTRSADGSGTRLILDEPCTSAHLAVFEHRIAIGSRREVVILDDDQHEPRRLVTDGSGALCFLDDGAMLASSGSTGEVRMWDTRTWAVRSFTAMAPFTTTFLATDPERALLFAGCNRDYGMVIWDRATGKQVAHSALMATNAGVLVGDRSIVVGTPGGSIEVFDLDVIRELARDRLATAEAGASIASARMEPSGVIISGAHVARVWGVAASPDGHWLATTAHDGLVKLWDATTDQLVRDLDAHLGVGWCAAFTADSRRLVTASDDVVLWDVDTGTPLRTTERKRFIAGGIACHPADPWAIWGRLDGEIEVWNLDRDEAPRQLKPVGGVVRQIAFSPDGRLVAAAYGHAGLLLWDTTREDFVAWRSGTTEVPPEPRQIERHDSSVDAVAFDPQGRWIATGSAAGTVLLVDLATDAPWTRLESRTRKIRSLSFDSGGHRLAVGCMDSVSVTWDLWRLQELFLEVGIDAPR